MADLSLTIPSMKFTELKVGNLFYLSASQLSFSSQVISAKNLRILSLLEVVTKSQRFMSLRSQ